MIDSARAAIVIVGFRNADDIRHCLEALAVSQGAPSFGVFICENGGGAAFEALAQNLCAPDGPCPGAPEIVPAGASGFLKVRRLRLGSDGPVVVLAEARENLGYGGGINACITALADAPDWRGVWVLNPDTEPAPDALAELISYATTHYRGMVGSRLMDVGDPDHVRTRGLKWGRLRASTMGVDISAPVRPEPAPGDVDGRIDAPSGASFYVTRDCINRIGLMDERYFLYYEDLDWGMRAKAACGIGHAHRSVVPHIGGSSIGSARRRAARSALAVYLEFRNRLLFVRRHYPLWFAWTVIVTLLRAGEYLAVGAVGNFLVALRGTYAGLTGETGRPDHIMARMHGSP